MSHDELLLAEGGVLEFCLVSGLPEPDTVTQIGELTRATWEIPNQIYIEWHKGKGARCLIRIRDLWNQRSLVANTRINTLSLGEEMLAFCEKMHYYKESEKKLEQLERERE